MITLDELQALDDAAFSREIAEAAGWAFERVGIDWQASPQYRVRRPDGTVVAYLVDSGRYTDIRPFSAIGDVIPDYAHDLNAAFSLRFDERVDMQWWAAAGKSLLEVRTAKSGYQAQHEQPARALATAWYTWRWRP